MDEGGCFFLRLEGGRRQEEVGLVQGWSGRGWGDVLGMWAGELWQLALLGLVVGAATTFNPPGWSVPELSSQH